jgi:hypothetical protein
MTKVSLLMRIPKGTIDYNHGYRYANRVTGEAFYVHPFGYHGKKVEASEAKWKPTKPVRRRKK